MSSVEFSVVCLNVVKTFFRKWWQLAWISSWAPMSKAIYSIWRNQKMRLAGIREPPTYVSHLVHCFAFKRTDEPWRGRGPHDPTSFCLVTLLKPFFSPVHILNKMHPTANLQTCQTVCILRLEPSLWFAYNLAHNTSVHGMMGNKLVDSRKWLFQMFQV